MEPRLSLVTLGVADLARARAFYEGLGWRLSPASQEGVAFYQGNGLALALFPRAELAADAGLPDVPTGFAGITLAYNARSVEEVDAVHALALSLGARNVKTPRAVFWGGHSGYFADPDGHLWEVAHNPFFPLDAHGNLTLPTGDPAP
ncbi:VOC family protein [Salinarimonas soli]|uniref:VOC family protein n=1 Tax=Salinarimonas soli TaxID=1638099 RepID=A0A5B2VB96_9HYPH|nr:VOC family protein [Salinarimonas soli]KAA2236331.1 VOC family protein [Salinarimonas soli]